MMAARISSAGRALGELLQGHARLPGEFDRTVIGLSADSRSLKNGELFFALTGWQQDGTDFIDEAIAKGAAAVVRAGRPGARLRHGVPELSVDNPRAALAFAADRYFDHPSARLRVVGVTGTNGKTSVAHFAAHLMHARERRVGLIGTLGYGPYGALSETTLTTPDAITVQRSLAELAGRGVDTVLMEASSHALEQQRLSAVEFDVAVLTNLTRDHLDYHGDMRAYARAKRHLFECASLRSAVVNADDPFGRELGERCAGVIPTICYGMTQARAARPPRRAAYVHGRIERLDARGLVLGVETSSGDGVVQTELLGRFNAHNLLAAIAIGLALEATLDDVLESLASVKAVPGRMQRLGGNAGEPLVVVDYAHTPDALGCALSALAEQRRAALWCVFGCGGDRDRGKRALMGEAAACGADYVVLTDDNPRTEDGARIVDDIRRGIPRSSAAQVSIERDRQAAIAFAVARAGPGDVVLVAGKGHESYQEIHGQRRPFSDAAAVRAALRERMR